MKNLYFVDDIFNSEDPLCEEIYISALISEIRKQKRRINQLTKEYAIVCEKLKRYESQEHKIEFAENIFNMLVEMSTEINCSLQKI